MKLWLLLGSATALIGALVGAYVYFTAPRIALQKAATHQAQAQTVQVQAQGQLDTKAAKTAAVETIHERTIVQQLPVVERRIAQAPGSDDLVDPRSAGAFFDGLCRLRADDPGCRDQDPGRSGAAPAVPEAGAARPQG